MPPQRVGFLNRFGLKTGTDFTHFGLESSLVFKGTTGMCESILIFGCVFFGKIQIRISESKNGFCVLGGKSKKRIIKSTLLLDSSDQIQIRIFEIHNLSVFMGKDLKKVFLTIVF